MGLIKDIMSRNDREKIKASASYMRKVRKKLCELVDKIKESVAEVQKYEHALNALGSNKTRENKTIKSKLKNSYQNLTKHLRELDKVCDMYYKIDSVYPEYNDEEKRELEELQKKWNHTGLSELPSEHWSLITKAILRENLEKARLLVG